MGIPPFETPGILGSLHDKAEFEISGVPVEIDHGLPRVGPGHIHFQSFPGVSTPELRNRAGHIKRLAPFRVVVDT